MASGLVAHLSSVPCEQKPEPSVDRKCQTSTCGSVRVCCALVSSSRVRGAVRKSLQLLHFVIVVVFVLGGLVEFIRNPSYFDAYGDAKAFSELPYDIFEHDPRKSRVDSLRLMDVPVIMLLIGYFGVCIWLRCEGLSWLLTFSLAIAFLTFWAVNFWFDEFFTWKFYSKRMSGLEVQVATLALCGTNVFMVLFYTRRKMPFKFKSSLPIQPLGKLHLAFNFTAIYVIQFTSMLLWFTKMYMSWACFSTQDDLLQLCQISTQVQCYACHECSQQAMRKCYDERKSDMFTCGASFPDIAKSGAFCIFNYSMSLVQFLTIFAYIGGLCVFLSTFLRIVGHYLLRAVFKLWECLNTFLRRSSRTLEVHKPRLHIRSAMSSARRRSLEPVINSEELACGREMIEPGAESVDGGRRSSRLMVELENDEQSQGDWYNASCG